jgi:arylsulfatase A-like enzyme
MTRRNSQTSPVLLTRRAVVTGGVAAGAALGLGSLLPADHPPPNVLFLCVDDLNDWIGPLRGHPDSVTPAFDRLARMGVTFERAYCPAPLCNASRAAVLSGVAPASSGLYDNETLLRDRLPNAVTLPQAFRAAGYKSVGGGKVFHGSFDYPAFPNHARRAPWVWGSPVWEAWDQYLAFPPEPLPENRPAIGVDLGVGPQFDWGVETTEEEELPDVQLARFTAHQLRQTHDKPLFLAAGLYRPHLPWYVPQRFLDLYAPDRVHLPAMREHAELAGVPTAGQAFTSPALHSRIVESGKWRDAVRTYLASIAFADHCLGLILDALWEGPNRDNTLVVLWSDNGWHLGEKLQWRKFTLWERATRVPLMIAGPGVAAWRKSPRPVNLLDLYPTLAELCGLKTPANLDGRSIAPLLRAPDMPWDHPSVSTWLEGNHAVRSERWRYIRYRDGGEELYDHSADPNEWNNLAADPKFAAVKAGLRPYMPARG